MNNISISMRLALLGIAAGATLAGAHAATAMPPTPAASAASDRVPARGHQSPLQSPAVRAAQGAAAPGDLRPQNQVLPQIAVPLRRGRDSAGSQRAGSAPAGNIDDSAARCRAAASVRERAACGRGGAASGSTQR